MPVAKTAAKPKTAAAKKTVKTPTIKGQKKAVSKPKLPPLPPNIKCSFCGKSAKNARRLIALVAPSKTSICDECIEVCILLLLKENPYEWATRITRIFAIYAEKNKELSQLDIIKSTTKSRISKK